MSKTRSAVDEMFMSVIEKLDGASPPEMRNLISQAIIETMPDEVKAEAATNPEAVTAAIQQAMDIANKLAVQIMFLFITQPKMAHKCEVSIGSLTALCRDKGIQVRAGEIEMDNKSNLRPTQSTGKA